tara:strand:- start:560 stop:1318 length:759 start_codon:yes stop_codon:yes gene_type:complete
MSQFFANFPLVGYNFGNETQPALFQNISAYIKIIDDISDDIAFYTTVHIQDYDRPDSFSFKLYGTTEFYWTFYFLNDDVRESGWPLPQQDLLPKAKVDYPHQTVITTANISKTFLPGHTVTGSISGSTGTVVKRYLDLGQIIIDSPNNFNVGENITPSINGVSQTADFIVVTSNVEQFNSVHHYENGSKEYVDIGLVPSGVGSGAFPSLSGKTPITYFDRILAKNDSLREIKVLKPNIAVQVKSEFDKLLQG